MSVLCAQGRAACSCMNGGGVATIPCRYDKCCETQCACVCVLKNVFRVKVVHVDTVAVSLFLAFIWNFLLWEAVWEGGGGYWLAAPEET